jgi:hypothetical protein
MSDGGAKRLRIGIMLDSWTVPAWMAKIIRDIQTSDFTELSLVIQNQDIPKPKQPFWKRLLTFDFNLKSWRGALFYFYFLADNHFFPNKVDAFAPVNLESLCQNVKKIEVMPDKKGFTDRFKKSDVDAVRACDLDMILRFGFRILRGEALSTARYGVWSYHHGDNLRYRGMPALFWELYENYPASGVVLQILTDDLDAGKVIYRSQAATETHSWSRQRNATFWKASHFVERRLRDLHFRGWDYLTSLPTYIERPATLGKIYRKPTNAQMVPFLWRMGVKNAGRFVRNRTHVDSWSLAWRRIARQQHILDGEFDVRGFQIIRPPGDRYFADPCAITAGGRTYVFFEDFRYGEQKGVVSCLELTASGPGEIATVLTRPYHLSYPFVFEHGGEIFMTPETSESRNIELYRAVDFPFRWEFSRFLMEGIEAVDPTLFRRDNRWWLFANIPTEGGLAHDELHLFYSDSLEGTWTPHPNNPVVSDVRKARPAGPVFEIEGSLIRPAQDCSITYGRAVSFQKITRLTENEYEEETVNRIEPPLERGNIGVHTYTFSNGFEILDAKREVWRGASKKPARTPK